MSVVQEIVYIILPLLLLAVVLVSFIGESGAWEEMKDALNSLFDTTEALLPDVSVGLNELNGNISVPLQVQAATASLNQTLEKMVGKKNCVAQYSGVPDVDQGAWRFYGNKLEILSGAGGKQVAGTLDVAMQPCVIAGKDNTADHFYDHFISDDDLLVFPYYQAVKELKISFPGTLSVPSFASNVVNDDTGNVESHGWLFTPDGVHACFFTTNDGLFGPGLHADEDGIHVAFFSKEKVRGKNIKVCDE